MTKEFDPEEFKQEHPKQANFFTGLAYFIVWLVKMGVVFIGVSLFWGLIKLSLWIWGITL